jgi:hypothetical protein
MIVDGNVEELASLHELLGEPNVLTARHRVAARMVMDDDERGRPFTKGRAEDLPGMNEGGGQCSYRHLGEHKVLKVGVEEDGPEVLAAVVDIVGEIPGYVCHGCGAVQLPR